MAIFRGSSTQHRYTGTVENTAGRSRTPVWASRAECSHRRSSSYFGNTNTVCRTSGTNIQIFALTLRSAVKSNTDRHPRLDFQTATCSEKTPYSVLCIFFHSPTMRKHICITPRSAYDCCIPKLAGTPHSTYLSRGILKLSNSLITLYAFSVAGHGNRYNTFLECNGGVFVSQGVRI